jgi:hypothetical protein
MNCAGRNSAIAVVLSACCSLERRISLRLVDFLLQIPRGV